MQMSDLFGIYYESLNGVEHRAESEDYEPVKSNVVALFRLLEKDFAQTHGLPAYTTIPIKDYVDE